MSADTFSCPQCGAPVSVHYFWRSGKWSAFHGAPPPFETCNSEMGTWRAADRATLLVQIRTEPAYRADRGRLDWVMRYVMKLSVSRKKTAAGKLQSLQRKLDKLAKEMDALQHHG